MASSSQQPPVFALDPQIQALVGQMVQARIADMEAQMLAQAEAWNSKENEMVHREKVMNQAMAELNAKLAAQESKGNINVVDATMSDNTVQPGPSSLTPRKHRTRKTVNPALRTLRSGNNFLKAAVKTQRPTARNKEPSLILPPKVEPSHDENIIGTTPALADPVGPAKAKRGRPPVVKPPAQIFRYLPQDMPKDLGGLQKAMALHIRILWGLNDAQTTPVDPPAEVIAKFNRQFSSEAQLYLCQDVGVELIPRHTVKVAIDMGRGQGKIAAQVRLVEQNMLFYIQAALAKFGLVCWAPDLRQSAYSLYNAACRIIALDTFRQALITHTYLHLNPNIVYASEMPVLIKLYDHFVYHYMMLRYQKERREPGRNAMEFTASPQYQGRIRLAAARLKFLVENNYPQRYRDLIDVKATSDDEYDASLGFHVIKRRPERSALVTKWFRKLDEVRKKTAAQDKSKKWRERKRGERPGLTDNTAAAEYSRFLALPEGMPIDYFDPLFFNNLQPRTRNRIAIKKIALGDTKEEEFFTWDGDERIDDKEFTKKHMAVFFKQYATVSDEDLPENADDEWDEHDLDEDSNMSIYTEDAASVTTAREGLSARLSSAAVSISSISGSGFHSAASDTN